METFDRRGSFCGDTLLSRIHDVLELSLWFYVSSVEVLHTCILYRRELPQCAVLSGFENCPFRCRLWLDDRPACRVAEMRRRPQYLAGMSTILSMKPAAPGGISCLSIQPVPFILHHPLLPLLPSGSSLGPRVYRLHWFSQVPCVARLSSHSLPAQISYVSHPARA